MARLYANENFPMPVVEELRKLGHDVLTMLEAGQTGQAMSDEAVLLFARQEGRAILTMNRRHFIRLHRDNPDHSGIIVCSFDPDFEELARRVHRAIEAEPALQGRLLRVNRPAPEA
ncbi:MAG: DUF5615 family PIN-like protein [Thermoflexales bacterium]|nr:DUF5615 family PIN-like protein [Thermoflexales bacterium]